METLNTYKIASCLLLTSAFLMTACGDNSTDSESDEFDVQLTSTDTHGDILTDGEGYTLYYFTHDVQGESMCEGECISNWPVFHVNPPNPGEGLEASDFGTITRSDGSSQSTYKGWPLYYFAGDENPGEINGDGLQDVWYTVNPSYSLMIASGQLVGADGNNYIVDENGEYVEGAGITTYFTDSEGRTLYIFINDEANTNNYTSPDDPDHNDVWPIFYTDVEALPSGISPDDFGKITVYEEQQLTYRSWPVYYFGGDSERGNTRGVSVPEPGIWPIINSDTPDAQ